MNDSDLCIDIQRKHATVFRIRLGDRSDDGYPQKLTNAIRVTSANRSVVEAFVAVYGGEVTAWDHQWQAYLPTMALPVLVLPGQSIYQRWELYKKSVCERRCNGAVEELTSKPCVCPADIATRMATKGACRPMTRINIACPEVAVVGAGSLVTHGMIAAETLPQSVAIAEAALSRGLMIPAVLRVLVHEGKKHYVVPQLEIVGVSIATLDSGQAPVLSPPATAGSGSGPATAAVAEVARPASSPAPAAPPPTRPGRLPPPPLPNETPSTAERQAVRYTINELPEDERKMTYALAKQSQIPNIDGPHFTLAHRDRLVTIVRQARVLVACRTVGVTSDDGRHEFVRGVLGTKESTKDLTKAEFVALSEALDEMKRNDEQAEANAG